MCAAGAVSQGDGCGAISGSDSSLSQSHITTPTLPTAVRQLLALEGRSHCAGRMTSFSYKTASFSTVATLSPATQCHRTRKAMVLTARETLPHSLIWHNYKFPQYVLLCVLFQPKLFSSREFFISAKRKQKFCFQVLFDCSRFGFFPQAVVTGTSWARPLSSVDALVRGKPQLHGVIHRL